MLGELEWVGVWVGQRAARWVAELGAAGSRTLPLGMRHTHTPRDGVGPAKGVVSAA